MRPSLQEQHQLFSALRLSEQQLTGTKPPRHSYQGPQSKAFLRWNRKMIRARKTNVYADPSKLYNELTDRFVWAQFDKRVTRGYRYKGWHKKLFGQGLIVNSVIRAHSFVNVDATIHYEKKYKNKTYVYEEKANYVLPGLQPVEAATQIEAQLGTWFGKDDLPFLDELLPRAFADFVAGTVAYDYVTLRPDKVEVTPTVPTRKQNPLLFRLKSAAVVCDYASCRSISDNTGRCVIDTVVRLLNPKLFDPESKVRSNKLKTLGKREWLVEWFNANPPPDWNDAEYVHSEGEGAGAGAGAGEEQEWEEEVVYEESDAEEEEPAAAAMVAGVAEAEAAAEEAVYDCERHGVTVVQLVALCREQKQPVRVLDATNRLIANHGVPRDEHGKTDPARSRVMLCLKVNNQHLYVIDNASMTSKLSHAITKMEGEVELMYKGRHRLDLDAESGDEGAEAEAEAAGAGVEAKQKRKGHKGKSKGKGKGKSKGKGKGNAVESPTIVHPCEVDITPETLANHSNTVIVCEEEDLFERHMQLLLKHNMCFDARLYVNQKGQLKSFGDLEHKVVWRSIPDFHRNVAAFERLFPGRQLDLGLVSSLSALCRETFEYPFDGSTFTPLTQSLRDKKCPIFCFDVYEPSRWVDVHALDFSKFYTACLYDSEHVFFLFNEFSHPEPFVPAKHTASATDCAYYVTKPALPTRFYMGPDWYYPELVQYWLEQGHITEADISHYVAAAHTIPRTAFRAHIERMLTLFADDLGTAKTLLNSLIGTMRQHQFKAPKVYFTADEGQKDALVQQQDCVRVRVAWKGGENMYGGVYESLGFKPPQYMVMAYTHRQLLQNYVSVHSQILDVSAKKLDLLCRHLETEHGARIVKIKTDCVWYEAQEPVDAWRGAGLFPDSQVARTHFQLKTEAVDEAKWRGSWQHDWSEREVLEHAVPEWRVTREEVDERVSGAVAVRLRELMDERESFYLGGGAGVGKSFLVDHVIRPYPNTFVLGSTHRAYLQIGGEDTLDAVMEKVKRKKVSLLHARVIVDEVSMCTPRHMMCCTG
jgi:hypothetical protein